jgi:hypothetical protein
MTLPGPSRTIIVEPVEEPAAPEPDDAPATDPAPLEPSHVPAEELADPPIPTKVPLATLSDMGPAGQSDVR